MEFTYDRYRDLLSELAASGAHFRAYSKSVRQGDVLLRHDVDLSPARALRVARIEADLGIEATYFFLVSTPLYNIHEEQTRGVVREIEGLGHDVGLHFSTHQYPWDGDPGEDAVAEAVDRERAALGTIVSPIETVAFHAPPDWVLRRKYRAFPSTYEPRFFESIDYLADSNQRWREDPPLTDGIPDRTQVLTHPGLWGEEDRSFEECVQRAARKRNERVESYAQARYVDPAREAGTETETPTTGR